MRGPGVRGRRSQSASRGTDSPTTCRPRSIPASGTPAQPCRRERWLGVSSPTGRGAEGLGRGSRSRGIPQRRPAADRRCRPDRRHRAIRAARPRARGLPVVLRGRPLRRVDALRAQLPGGASDPPRPLPGIHTPVQIIAGARDPAVPPVNAEFLRERLPHSRFDLMDAGHFTWEDGADEYAALVMTWWPDTRPPDLRRSARRDEAHDRARPAGVPDGRAAPISTPSCACRCAPSPLRRPGQPVRGDVEAEAHKAAGTSIETGDARAAPQRCSGLGKSKRAPASHSERWLPWAGIPPASLSIRAMWSRFQVANVVLRLVKSFSGPPEPSSR